MFKLFKRWSDKRRDETELAELRVLLNAMTEVLTQFEAPEDQVVFMARVGARIRRILEHRFGWSRDTFIESDADLRNEEKLIDAMSIGSITDLYLKARQDADESGKKEEIEQTLAMRLLAGWLKSKQIALRTTDPSVRLDAREHAALHLSHIRNLMRIVRGESPVTTD